MKYDDNMTIFSEEYISQKGIELWQKLKNIENFIQKI